MEYKLDKPISNTSADLLNRADFANNVSDAIIKLSATGECAVVGIQGDWGCGKTSVSRLVEQCIKTKLNYIRIVRLETWLATDRESLFKEFFTCILDAIDGDGKLHVCYEEVKDYANQFGRRFLRSCSFNVGLFSNSVNVDMSKMIDEPKPRTLESRKQAINKKLKDIDIKPIVFFIDDIDRLSYDEIAALFQIVKNIADFKKVIYVLCYDKVIVGNALEKIHSGKGYQYIEKVVQIPIDIPAPGESVINQYFTSLLDALFNESYDKATQFDKGHWNGIFNDGISMYLKNIRDCNRLYNSFMFKYDLIGKECDFADLMTITFLANESPKILDCIRRNKNTLLGTNGFFSVDIKSETAKQVWEEISSASTLENSEPLKTIISWMFPKFACKAGLQYNAWTANVDKETNKIDNPKYFDRYFCLSLDKGEVSNIEVNAWLDCDKQADIESWLNVWRSENKLEDALNEANKLIKNPDKNNYKVCTRHGFIQLLYAFTNQKLERSSLKFLGLGEETLRDFIISNILTILLKMPRKTEYLRLIFEDNSINISLKSIILIDLSAGYDWCYGSKVLKKSKCLLDEKEFLLAQKMFVECILREKESDAFLYNDNCSWILEAWKYIDVESYKNYMIEHQDPKDILKFVLICIHEGKVTSSSEPPYKEWVYTTSMWLDGLDFDLAVEVVRKELTDKKYTDFNINQKIKFCSLIKFAELKMKCEAEGQTKIRLVLRLEDFIDICEKYGVLPE